MSLSYVGFERQLGAGPIRLASIPYARTQKAVGTISRLTYLEASLRSINGKEKYDDGCAPPGG
jgi:hypothetical protein